MRFVNKKKKDELIPFVYFEKLLFFTEGDLQSYLSKWKDTLWRKQLLSMCKDVATGMAYLECKKLFHR